MPKKSEAIDYKYTFKHSPFYIAWIYIQVVIGIVLGWYLYFNYNEKSGLIIFGLSILILLLSRKVLLNSVKIKISDNGIWTKSLGFLKWDEIWMITVDEKNCLKYISSYGDESMTIYQLKNGVPFISDRVTVLGLINKEMLISIVNDKVNCKRSIGELEEYKPKKLFFE